MAHNTTSHRRNLAAPDPPSPTHRTTTARNHHRRHHPPPTTHPVPDPIAAAPPSTTTTTTIQNISHRFSKLYLNHKKLVTNSTKPPHPHPEPETHNHFQTKKIPSFSDTSCTTLTKSSSHHERNTAPNQSAAKIADKDHYLSTKTKVKEKDGSKKSISKKDPLKRSSFDEFDVKKASQLIPKKSLEKVEEEVKMVGRSSVSSMVNGGGRRRSFCSSQVELADFFSAAGVKVVAVDMPPFMQIHAVDCARKAHDSLEKFTSKTLAFTLKKEFDGVYGPAWHCIVGTSFGSFVTHSVGGFMYFSMDHKIYILLFKTTVQRAAQE